jgi:hypothetical protein
MNKNDEFSFFSALKRKLAVKPDRNFDQRFWNRFEAEFGKKPKKSLISSQGWFRLALVSVSAAAITLVLFQQPQIVIDEVALDEIEFYQELDNLEIVLTEADFNLMLENANDS